MNERTYACTHARSHTNTTILGVLVGTGIETLAQPVLPGIVTAKQPVETAGDRVQPVDTGTGVPKQSVDAGTDPEQFTMTSVRVQIYRSGSSLVQTAYRTGPCQRMTLLQKE